MTATARRSDSRQPALDAFAGTAEITDLRSEIELSAERKAGVLLAGCIASGFQVPDPEGEVVVELAGW
ncbi:MAG: hypothetical protein ABWY04_12320, partial [Arthrobacter sp.]